MAAGAISPTDKRHWTHRTCSTASQLGTLQVFKKENIKSKSKNTAIEDRKLQGKVEKTFINGDLVFSE